MIPILQPININTNIKKDEINIKKDEIKVKNVSIPILPPINTSKYEIKVKKENNIKEIFPYSRLFILRRAK